jgi:putative two-component system response regulator
LRLLETGGYPEIDQEFIEAIGIVAAMHDVGKIGTPDDILNKDGKLEHWEWEVMKEHTINGAYILSTHPEEMAKHIALFHHEWFDGSGYPYGISDQMIPLPSRIVALADVYDALRMERSYKKAFSHRLACQEIERGRGNHFDPEISGVFLEMGDEIARVFSDLAEV